MLTTPLTILGVILILGAMLGDAAERLRVPWITGCIVLGVLLGPAAAGLLSQPHQAALGDFTQVALALIAFNIGSQLQLDQLRTIGRSVAILAIAQLIAPLVLVLAAVLLLGLPFPAALVVAAVAPATAPTTTYSVLRRLDASGPFADRVMGILALNDSAAVLIFSALSAGAVALLGTQGASAGLGIPVFHAAVNELTSIALGGALGVVYLAVRRVVEDGTPGWQARVTAMLLGLLVVSIGSAIALGLSHLLVPLSLGVVIANGVDGAERQQVHSLIRAFEEPLFIVFFVLAGAHLPVSAAENATLLALAVAYVAARFLGKYGGVYLAASAMKLDRPTRRYLGFCFPSQGALAMGLILAFRASPAVAQLPPAAAQSIESAVSIILVAVLLSQLFGPLLIDFAVRRGSAPTRVAASEGTPGE